MARHKKRPAGRRTPGRDASRSHSPWLFATTVLCIAALLGAAVYWIVRRSTIQPPALRANSRSSVAEEKSPLTLPPTSTGAGSTNPLETTDIEMSAVYQNRGTELLAQGKVDEAVLCFRKAVALNADNEDSHYNLALGFSRQGNREGAEREYLEALRIYPDYSEAHNNLGNLLVTKGKFDQALEHFRTAIRVSPDNASAENNLGSALARQGRVVEAIPCFREALRINPDYLEARYNLGSAYLSQGRIDEAIPEFEGILKQHPDFAPAQSGLARARRLQANEEGKHIP